MTSQNVPAIIGVALSADQLITCRHAPPVTSRACRESRLCWVSTAVWSGADSRTKPKPRRPR